MLGNRSVSLQRDPEIVLPKPSPGAHNVQLSGEWGRAAHRPPGSLLPSSLSSPLLQPAVRPLHGDRRRVLPGLTVSPCSPARKSSSKASKLEPRISLLPHAPSPHPSEIHQPLHALPNYLRVRRSSQQNRPGFPFNNPLV